MTDIKQAQAALDMLSWADFDDLDFGRGFEEYAPVVKEALQNLIAQQQGDNGAAYIEREQGWRTDFSNAPDEDWYVMKFSNDASGKEIDVVVKNVEDGYKMSDGFDVSYDWTPIAWTPLPTNNERGE